MGKIYDRIEPYIFGTLLSIMFISLTIIEYWPK
jgi:hypothetical protein